MGWSILYPPAQDQALSIPGAYYPADDVTFPEPEADAKEWIRFVQVDNPVCASQNNQRQVERIANLHPSKRIRVTYREKFPAKPRRDVTDVVLDPQGRRPVVGCTHWEGSRVVRTVTSASYQ